jgi:hypothetical protein
MKIAGSEADSFFRGTDLQIGSIPKCHGSVTLGTKHSVRNRNLYHGVLDNNFKFVRAPNISISGNACLG